MKALLLLAIRVYRRGLSPILARWSRCRFHPTCSEYAEQAIRSYGAIDGVRRTWRRLRRCRPDNFESCIDYP